MSETATPSKPSPLARAARRAGDRAQGQAREALNQALDLLGERLPDPGELAALVRLAGEAFAPESAAARLLRILLLARMGGKRR